MVELAVWARRLARALRAFLGSLAALVVLAILIPIGNSLWAVRLMGTGTIHTGKWTPVSHGCTYTQGYWRNHPEAWPEDEIEIGGGTYRDAEAIAILETPPGGDATYILAHQLIAATVNSLNGADASAIMGPLREANAWLEAHPLGSDPENPARERGIELSITLTDYNEGRTGPGLCEEDACTATPTVTATGTSTATPTATPTDTATATPTPSTTIEARGASPEVPTPTPTPSDTPAPSPTDTSTATLEPTAGATETPEVAPTEPPELVPTDTVAAPPTDTPSPEPSP